MEDEPHVDFNRGLAEEEKKDLEKLLGAFRDEHLDASFDAQEDMEKQLAFLKEKMSRMSVVLLDLDKKVHSLYEIVRLFHRKTEVMNERISDVIKLLKKDKQP